MTGPGHALDEVAVDRGADAEGEEVGRLQIVANQLKDLGLHVHVAVGGHRHDPGDPLGAGQAQGLLHGRHDVGAAAAGLGLDKGQGLLFVLLAGRQGAAGRQDGLAAGKQDDIQKILGPADPG